MADETVRLTLDLGSSSVNTAELSTKLHTLDTDITKVAAATEKLGSKTVNTGQQLLQTGRVVQDFAQGGLGGILNNIEGLTVALGLGSGMAGVLTVLGVAALVAGPRIKGAFNALIDGSNEVPKSTDKVKGLDAALKHTTERLEELAKQQRLTNSELKEFNTLSAEQERLELRQKAAKAAESARDILAPELRMAGDAIKKANEAFGGQAVQDEVARAYGAATGVNPAQAHRSVETLLFRSQKGDTVAQELIQDILRKSAASGAIANVLLGGQTPEEKAKAKAVATKKKEEEWEKAEKARLDGLKKTDALNQQGQDQQREGEKELHEGIRKDDHEQIKHAIAAEKAEEKRSAQAWKDKPQPSAKELAEGDVRLKARYEAEVARREAMGGLGLKAPIVPGSKGINRPRMQRPIRKLQGSNPGDGARAPVDPATAARQAATRAVINAAPKPASKDISAEVRAADKRTAELRDKTQEQIAKNQIAQAQNDLVRAQKIYQLAAQASTQIASARSAGSNGSN